jgi:hypothetical protein
MLPDTQVTATISASGDAQAYRSARLSSIPVSTSRISGPDGRRPDASRLHRLRGGGGADGRDVDDGPDRRERQVAPALLGQERAGRLSVLEAMLGRCEPPRGTGGGPGR